MLQLELFILNSLSLFKEVQLWHHVCGMQVIILILKARVLHCTFKNSSLLLQVIGTIEITCMFCSVFDPRHIKQH